MQGSGTKAVHEVLVLTNPLSGERTPRRPWIALLKTEYERGGDKKKRWCAAHCLVAIPASLTARADRLEWEPKSPLAWGSYTPRPQLTFSHARLLRTSCPCARDGTYLALPPGLSVRTCLFEPLFMLRCTEPLFLASTLPFLPTFVVSPSSPLRLVLRTSAQLPVWSAHQAQHGTAQTAQPSSAQLSGALTACLPAYITPLKPPAATPGLLPRHAAALASFLGLFR